MQFWCPDLQTSDKKKKKKKKMHFLQPIKFKTIGMGNFKGPFLRNHTSGETAKALYTINGHISKK